MTNRVDVLGLGIAPVDFFVSMTKHPAVGLKIDGLPGSALIAGGGPVPTALCTFSRLGGSAALITAFGDDSWGVFARKELDRFGVDHRHCLTRKNCPSAQAFAWIEVPGGARTIVLDMSPRIAVKPADIKTSRLPHPTLIHIDGRHVPACAKLARWGKRVGARVMLDVGSVRNAVDELFPHVDILICADQYACHYFKTTSPEKAARGFRKLGISEVVVTAGTAGSFGIAPDGRTHRREAYLVDAVDVTGAGDVFHGAYLFGRHRGWDMSRTMRFASAAAALKCLRPGARDGIPSYRRTLAFIKARES